MYGTRQQLTDTACQSITLPVIIWNQTQLFFSSPSKPVPRPPCLELDNISLMPPIKAEFLVIVSGTRHNLFHPCHSLYLGHDVWNQTTFH